ncbi:hypothetical protein GCM10010522_06450 [Kribbella solani]
MRTFATEVGRTAGSLQRDAGRRPTRYSGFCARTRCCFASNCAVESTVGVVREGLGVDTVGEGDGDWDWDCDGEEVVSAATVGGRSALPPPD